MVFIILTILVIFCISAIADAGKSYSISRGAVNKQTIQLDSTDKRSYTHYMAIGLNARNYSFSIHTSEDFQGVFIGIVKFRLINVADKTAPTVCDVYQIQFTYPDGLSRLLCNGTKMQFAFDEEEPGMISDFSGNSGHIVVGVFISAYWNSFWIDKLDTFVDGPLVGPTGREIPKTTIASITFTAYKDCSDTANFTQSTKFDLRSCSNSSKSKCIASDLFCDGDINCGFLLVDEYLDDQIVQTIRDGNDEECLNPNWKQKPRQSWELGPTSKPDYTDSKPTSNTRPTRIIIPVGLVLFLIAIFARACSQRNVNSTPGVVHTAV